MEIWIVRHGDPDYVHDTLTEKGEREAKLLADRLSKIDFSTYYCSPLGRAKKTASYTLEKSGKTAVTCKWLREFKGKVRDGKSISSCWDRMPSYWCNIDDYYSYDNWMNVDLMKTVNVNKQYKKVCKGIDDLMANHGYVHDGNVYKVVKANSDKIVLFCHFGVECVMLSHIFHQSPMVLWHNFVALPTSVTRIVSEEREEGTAIFRCMYFGDISHLYKGDEELSFQARFCERYSDDTRH